MREKKDVKYNLAIEQDASKIENLQEELEKVSEDIAEMCAAKNKELANEYLKELNDPLEGFNIAKMAKRYL